MKKYVVRLTKAIHKVLAHPHLAFYLRGRVGTRDLRKIVQAPGVRGLVATNLHNRWDARLLPLTNGEVGL